MTIVTTIVEATPVRGEDSHPLWYQYPGRPHPQNAFLALDCRDGRAWCGFKIEDFIPLDAWHSHVLHWRVNAYLRAGDIEDLMSECLPLLQAIVDGYGSRWNGSNNVGTYTEAASGASWDVARLCGETFSMDLDPCDAECRVCWGDEDVR